MCIIHKLHNNIKRERKKSFIEKNNIFRFLLITKRVKCNPKYIRIISKFNILPLFKSSLLFLCFKYKVCNLREVREISFDLKK